MQAKNLILAATLLLALRGLALCEPPPASADVTSVHERLEWVDLRIDTAQGIPRVLLLGDSITRLYFPAVQENLRGRASVSLVSTSFCAGDPELLAAITPIIEQYHFDIIHVNNGLHGFLYPDESYRAGMQHLIDVLRQNNPHALLIVASTTPVKGLIEVGGRQTDVAQIISRRNNIAVMLAQSDHIELDDLAELAQQHPEFYRFGSDGIHPNNYGVQTEGAQVTKIIASALHIATPTEKSLHSFFFSLSRKMAAIIFFCFGGITATAIMMGVYFSKRLRLKG
jgi:hypothetical protein